MFGDSINNIVYFFNDDQFPLYSFANRQLFQKARGILAENSHIENRNKTFWEKKFTFLENKWSYLKKMDLLEERIKNTVLVLILKISFLCFGCFILKGRFFSPKRDISPFYMAIFLQKAFFLKGQLIFSKNKISPLQITSC